MSIDASVKYLTLLYIYIFWNDEMVFLDKKSIWEKDRKHYTTKCVSNNSIVHVKVLSEMVLSFRQKKEKERFLCLEK